MTSKINLIESELDKEAIEGLDGLLTSLWPFFSKLNEISVK